MTEANESVVQEAPAESLRLSIRAYLALNALVWIYALGVALVAKAMLRDWMGIGFVSIALPVGVTLVSILDSFYDRLHLQKS